MTIYGWVILAVVVAVFAFSGGGKTPAGDGTGSPGTTSTR